MNRRGEGWMWAILGGLLALALIIVGIMWWSSISHTGRVLPGQDLLDKNVTMPFVFLLPALFRSRRKHRNF